MALFNEAKDFERSNTIDAYDYAINLYNESKRYFDLRFNKYITNIFILYKMLVANRPAKRSIKVIYTKPTVPLDFIELWGL